jgi:hypothetical protein
MTVMKMSWHVQYVQSMVNEGKTGNLKKKVAMEVEHEIEREFIWINNTYVYAQYMYVRLVWNKNYMLSESV